MAIGTRHGSWSNGLGVCIQNHKHGIEGKLEVVTYWGLSKSSPQWCTSSSKAILPKSPPNSTIYWGPSVQIAETMGDISPPNHHRLQEKKGAWHILETVGQELEGAWATGTNKQGRSTGMCQGFFLFIPWVRCYLRSMCWLCSPDCNGE